MSKNNKSIDVDSFLTKDQLITDLKELKLIKNVALKYNLHYTTVSRKIRQFDILKYASRVIYNCDEYLFSLDSEKSFYLAGFIAADGNVQYFSTKQSQLKIILAEKDKEYLIKLRNLLDSDAHIFTNIAFNSKRNKNWNDTINYGFQITSNKICNDLQKFNIVPRKTKIYSFPKWLIGHPLVNHFMRGYNDGDGCLRARKGVKSNKLGFHLVGNQDFLEIYKLILDANCKIENPNKTISIRKNGLGALEYSGNIIVNKICDFLYNDATIFLERKHNIILQSNNLQR